MAGNGKNDTHSGAEDALKAANDSCFAAWVAFITFCAVVAVSIATTTDRELLFGGTIKLPLIDAALSTSGFYKVAPILLIALHSYFFFQMHLLVKQLPASRALPDDTVIMSSIGIWIAGRG